MSYAMRGSGATGCCGGMGAYYTFNSGQTFQAFGAIDFNPTSVWADIMAVQGCGVGGKTCGSATWARGQNGYDSVRAALAELGYGLAVMKKPWDSADQNAYESWRVKNSLSPSPAGRGMPAQAHLGVMSEQLRKGIVTGDQPPVRVTKKDGEFVPSTVVGEGAKATAKAGVPWMWIGIGAGVLLLVGVAAAASKKRQQPGYAPGYAPRQLREPREAYARLPAARPAEYEIVEPAGARVGAY